MRAKKINDNDAWKIAKALDKVCEKYDENLDIIFETENERRKQIFLQIREQEKFWSTSQKCIFYGCNKDSIVRSHTIQKAGPLEQISENGHVATPRVVRGSEEIAVSLIGINVASTFPGFCNEHELLFSKFENKKSFVDDKDFTLQIYRTVCREVFVKRFALEDLLKTYNWYVEYRNNKFKQLIMKELSQSDLVAQVAMSKIEFQNYDPREKKLKMQIKKAKKQLREIESDFYIVLSNQLLEGKNYKFALHGFLIDIELPLCLAGIGEFSVKGSFGTRDITALLHVIPSEGKTYILMIVPAKYKQYLASYANVRLRENEIDIINTIESWMIHGTDHWFIKPSVWNKIREEKRQEIAKDILDFNKNIGTKYRFTIFNDLKRKVLKSNLLGEGDKFTD